MAQGTHEDVVELVAGVGESDLATVLEDHFFVAVDDESCWIDPSLCLPRAPASEAPKTIRWLKNERGDRRAMHCLLHEHPSSILQLGLEGLSEDWVQLYVVLLLKYVQAFQTDESDRYRQQNS